MAAKSKRRTPKPEPTELPSAAEGLEVSIPRPDPPRPNKRLLQVSAVLFLAWFCFLIWMAKFQ